MNGRTSCRVYGELLHDAKILRKKRMAYEAIVDRLLDNPIYREWFDSSWNMIGNEFDLRQNLEENIEFKEASNA